MRFLFKPSLSYALIGSVAVTVSLIHAGHWVAATIWMVGSAIAGGITEAVVMDQDA